MKLATAKNSCETNGSVASALTAITQVHLGSKCVVCASQPLDRVVLSGERHGKAWVNVADAEKTWDRIGCEKSPAKCTKRVRTAWLEQPITNVVMQEVAVLVGLNTEELLRAVSRRQ